MKKLLLLTTLFSFNCFAVDSLIFQIDRLHVAGSQGELSSKEILIGSDGDYVGYRKSNDLYGAEITIKDKMVEITGTNGMFLKTTSPIALKEIPETIVENGKFSSIKGVLELNADFLSTSANNIAIEVGAIKFNCDNNDACRGQASKLVIDSHTMVGNPSFTCQRTHCGESFNLQLASFDDGKTFTARNSNNKALIDLKDLRTVTVERNGNSLKMNGKLHVLIGVIDFEFGATILNLTPDVLELRVDKVKVSNFLSLKDFSIFLVQKLVSTKKFSINGDHLIINLN